MPARSQPRGRGQAGGHQQRHAGHVDAVHDHDAHGEDGLEGEQLQGDGTGLAEEDPGRVEARQAQGIPAAVGRLDREGPLDGEQPAEQHGDPEQAGAGPREDPAVGVEGEAEEDQHEDGEGRHLLRGHL